MAKKASRFVELRVREADWHGGSLAASSRAGKAAVQLRVCHKFTGYFLNAGLCHLKRREPRRGGIFVEGRLPFRRSKSQRHDAPLELFPFLVL